jgi:DNA-damage-inducible protein D
MRSIAIREELTDEWQQHGVREQKEYSILTAEIAKATFGITPSEHKSLKSLKSQNSARSHDRSRTDFFNAWGSGYH